MTQTSLQRSRSRSSRKTPISSLMRSTRCLLSRAVDHQFLDGRRHHAPQWHLLTRWVQAVAAVGAPLQKFEGFDQWPVGGEGLLEVLVDAPYEPDGSSGRTNWRGRRDEVDAS